MRRFLRGSAIYVATGFGIGFVPGPSGTYGTALSAAIYACFMGDLGALGQCLVGAGLLALGLLSCHFAAPAFAEPDPRHFVIDEFIGFYCSVLLLPWDWKTVVAAFLLFRLFDITKPFPARPLDKKLPGALGVVVDDVVAGIYANLGVRLVRMWI